MYASLIRLAARQGSARQALTLFSELEGEGLTPDCNVFARLAWAVRQVRDYSLVPDFTRALLRHPAAAGHHNLGIDLTALAAAAARAGEGEAANALVSAMVQVKIAPSSAEFATYLQEMTDAHPSEAIRALQTIEVSGGV